MKHPGIGLRYSRLQFPESVLNLQWVTLVVLGINPVELIQYRSTIAINDWPGATVTEKG